jgi:hypothetical protein
MTELQDEIEIRLHKPIPTTSGETGTLKLREPTAGELDKFLKAAARDPSGITATLDLIMFVSGVERPFLEKMAARDFHACSEYLAPFIGGSPKPGETP